MNVKRQINQNQLASQVGRMGQVFSSLVEVSPGQEKDGRHQNTNQAKQMREMKRSMSAKVPPFAFITSVKTPWDQGKGPPASKKLVDVPSSF